jgi:catechol 2,3-dioxygenase-like lactoylglutathione lyase family enzyme
MTGIHSLTIGVDDLAAAEAFYEKAFDLGGVVQLRESREPTSGFRGLTVSLVVSQPGNVDALVRSALDAGATELKPVKKSFWGTAGVVQAPDGTIWKIATSAKKDTGPATREVDEVVLLLGVDDVKATKEFYGAKGLPVGKSFGGKYAEFDTPGATVKLALYPRKAAAKDAGVDPAGSGSHRIAVTGDAGEFTDPDGYAWETAS